eukprot:GHRR01011523.1.p1 GENE.GHRR01011523.1~~GHRR01011523.1.p1  ORF type:complete len:306 (+),score=58.76 GHRR01011523.1:632-1549(+)
MFPTSTMPSAVDCRARSPAPWGGARLAAVKVGGIAMDYILDWALVVVAIIMLIISDKATPREGYISKATLSDTNYPLLPNTVPSWSVPVYCLLVPAVLLTLRTVFLRRPMLEAHHLVLGLATAVLVDACITNLLKCPIGRLRPDFNARCWPDGKIQWQQENEWGGYANCTGDPGSIAEGRKSFPSGHSSWSSSGLGYLTWFLLDWLQAFDGSGHPWRLIVAVLPSFGALAVGITRYVDYWHHPTDIAAGLLLGWAISWVCYRQQRSRLAEVDPVMYGAPASSSIRRLNEDGLPLLQQPGSSLLPM